MSDKMTNDYLNRAIADLREMAPKETYSLGIGNKILEQEIIARISANAPTAWFIFVRYLIVLDAMSSQSRQDEQSRILATEHARGKTPRAGKGALVSSDTDLGVILTSLDWLKSELTQLREALTSSANGKSDQVFEQLVGLNERLETENKEVKSRNSELINERDAWKAKMIESSRDPVHHRQVGAEGLDTITARFITFCEQTVPGTCDTLITEFRELKLMSDNVQAREVPSIIRRWLYSTILVEEYSLALQRRYRELIQKSLHAGENYPLSAEAKRYILESVVDSMMVNTTIQSRELVKSKADKSDPALETTSEVTKGATNNKVPVSEIATHPISNTVIEMDCSVAGSKTPLLSSLGKELNLSVSAMLSRKNILEAIDQFCTSSATQISSLLAFEEPVELYFPIEGDRYEAEFQEIVKPRSENATIVSYTVRPGLRFHGECLLKATVAV